MIESQRLQSINSQLVTDLQFARSESATRNAYVRVTFRSNASGTCYSLYTYTNNATQCDCRNATPCTAAGLVEIKTVQVKIHQGSGSAPKEVSQSSSHSNPSRARSTKFPLTSFRRRSRSTRFALSLIRSAR
ncbi:MAG: GspH/FimT family protein [Rubrivivax sp.]|nr:GspH/FimT family protein [Rubrivivax sp.]